MRQIFILNIRPIKLGLRVIHINLCIAELLRDLFSESRFSGKGNATNDEEFTHSIDYSRKRSDAVDLEEHVYFFLFLHSAHSSMSTTDAVSDPSLLSVPPAWITWPTLRVPGHAGCDSLPWRWIILKVGSEARWMAGARFVTGPLRTAL